MYIREAANHGCQDCEQKAHKERDIEFREQRPVACSHSVQRTLATLERDFTVLNDRIIWRWWSRCIGYDGHSTANGVGVEEATLLSGQDGTGNVLVAMESLVIGSYGRLEDIFVGRHVVLFNGSLSGEREHGEHRAALGATGGCG